MTREDLQQISELLDTKLEPIKSDLKAIKNDSHVLTGDMADFFIRHGKRWMGQMSELALLKII